MLNVYNVYLDDKVVGTAQLTPRGLFYHVHCRYNIDNGKFYRLCAICGERVVDLGICVPFYDGFGIEAMERITKFDSNEIRFYIVKNNESSEDKFFVLNEEAPFENLEIVMDARFERRNGEAGLIITNHSESLM